MEDKQIVNNLNALIRPEIREMQAYHVPDATGLVKLDAMENPYSWPISMKNDWLEIMKETEINRYPDPAASELKKQIRLTFQIEEDLGLILGNGSDELIQLMLMALSSDSTVMAPMPSFVMYQHLSKSLGLSFKGIPLNADFSLDMPAMLSFIKDNNPAIIFLAYPNNPTANLFNEADVLSIIRASKGLVVVDEAYQPFAGKSLLKEVAHYANLMVMRTVSKLGLAGLRLGYLVGNETLINEFEKIRLPYNINVLTQLTAGFAFNNINVLDQQAQLICQQRDEMLLSLQALSGVRVFPSQANFILFSLSHAKAADVFEQLKNAGVLIKKLGAVTGLPAECLRVTIGSEDQNKSFLDALTKILNFAAPL